MHTYDFRLDCHVYAQLRKQRHFLRVVRSPSFYFVCMHHNYSFNTAPRTASVEDTYPTLTAILFQVGVNNSSKDFRKICQAFVPVKSLVRNLLTYTRDASAIFTPTLVIYIHCWSWNSFQVYVKSQQLTETLLEIWRKII